MAIYEYTAKKGPSEVVKGELEADSEKHALAILEEMRLIPVKIVEAKAEASQRVQGPGDKAPASEKKRSHASSTRVRQSDVGAFTRQLASLIKSSIPMLRALALIAQQTESKALGGVVADLERQVKDGKMLSEALEKYPYIFNNLYLNMIKAGEKSGALDEVLYKLAEHRERDDELRRKIQAALAYPALVIAVGAGTIFIMFTYFLPKLIKLFENMKETLPLPTRIMIGLTRFMSNYWGVFVVLLFFGLVVFGRAKPHGKKKFLIDMIKLHLPFIKKFVRDAEIARFARSLGLLLKNGITVYESLELSADTLDNEAMRERLRFAAGDIVNKGCTLSESLKRSGVFPPFAINMIAVGEEGGRLEESLSEIANVYEREVDQSIKVTTSLIEPVLILIVGGVVGFIVFAMLLPIFNIGGMAK